MYALIQASVDGRNSDTTLLALNNVRDTAQGLNKGRFGMAESNRIQLKLAHNSGAHKRD